MTVTGSMMFQQSGVLLQKHSIDDFKVDPLSSGLMFFFGQFVGDDDLKHVFARFQIGSQVNGSARKYAFGVGGLRVGQRRFFANQNRLAFIEQFDLSRQLRAIAAIQFGVVNRVSVIQDHATPHTPECMAGQGDGFGIAAFVVFAVDRNAGQFQTVFS